MIANVQARLLVAYLSGNAAVCDCDCPSKAFGSISIGERLPLVIATVQARLLVAYLSGNGCRL